MAMITVKCKCCKKSINKESAINPEPRFYYCSDECLKEATIKKEKQKTKVTEAKAKVCPNCNEPIEDKYFILGKRKYCDEHCAKNFLGVEEYYRLLLLDEIWKAMDKQGDFPALQNQLKNIAQSNEYRYAGMYKTFIYYTQILQEQYNPHENLWAFIWNSNYYHAKRFYQQQALINKAFSDSELILETEPTKITCKFPSKISTEKPLLLTTFD